MDNLDMAQEHEERHRRLSLSNARVRSVANSVTECECCGAPIGEARKKALPSARLCMRCQTLSETRRGV